MTRRPSRLAVPLAALGVALLSWFAPHAAHAVVTCSFNSVSALAFGSYNPSLGALDTTGSIVILCTGEGAGSITVDISSGHASGFTPREMLGPMGSLLVYNVYLNAARTQIWGDGSGGTVRYGPVDPPRDDPFELTMYGRIPGSQLVRPGTYGDTLTVTINY